MLHPREMLTAWQHRAAPIFRRMMLHSKRCDPSRISETLRLVLLFPSMDPACFAPENAHRSHHLKNCPLARRNAGKNLTVSPREVVTATSIPIPAWKIA